MNLLRITYILFLLVILSSGGCGKPDDPNRHYEKDGDFSFVPPEGWEASEYPGLKYLTFRGERADNFTPNINVVDEKFDGSLEEYVKANIETMRNYIDGFDLVKRDNIVTNDGKNVIKLAVDGEHYGRYLRQFFYFLDGKGKKFVLTGSSLADVAEAFEPTFDRSVKTFRLE